METWPARDPPARIQDKVERCESMNHRSVSRALDRLERLQRRRKSEQDLPVVSVL